MNRQTYEEECIEALHEDVRQKLARLCLAGYRFKWLPIAGYWIVDAQIISTGLPLGRITRRYYSLTTAIEREWQASWLFEDNVNEAL